ncbi:hypothetical protein BGZ49_008726 [Haplosporangium sp. Z 27]|nr:hypothetical protein BGZ49_008726 [Haplosporangium sp. Z 27]
MDSIEITPDKDWLAKAPKPPPRGPDAENRFLLAHTHPFASCANENATKALRNLLQFGLIAEPTGGSSLAHYIADTILNYALRKNALKEDTASPFKFQLKLDSGHQELAIPTRSRLMLLYLSQLLNVSIYMFSARSKSTCFKNSSATTSIAFFHRIDSFYGVSEYLVLAPSPHIPVVKDVPLPKNPPVFTSSTSAATFRQVKRPQQKRALEDVSKVEDDTCRKIFKRACVDSIEDLIQSAVAPIFKKKKFNNGETKEQLLADSKAQLDKKFSGKERVPRGIMEKAVGVARSEYNLNSNFTFQDLQKKLGDPKDNIKLWKEAVRSDFSRAWAGAMLRSKEGGPNKTTEAGIAIEELEDKSDEEDSEGEYEEEDEEESDDKELIKTCSTTLRNILRPDLQGQPEPNGQDDEMDLEDYHDRVVSILVKRQTELTDVIAELSTLTHKTILVIASGELYDESLGPRSTSSFDVRGLLPSGFKFRCNVKPIINMAPIPIHLQDHLETSIEHGKDDLTQILSQDHLQFMHTSFLSAKEKVDKGKHPLWQRAANFIKENGAINPPASPVGLSHTVTEQIRQFSTAVNNIWEGSIFNKSMEYLLRILLRLHLAPVREEKFKQKVRLNKEKKKHRVESTRTVSRSLRKRKVKLLCDELADIQQSSRDDKSERMQAIMKKLMELNSVEPTATSATDNPIPCLEEQPRQFIEADSATAGDNEASDTSECLLQHQSALVPGVLIQDDFEDFDEDFDFDFNDDFEYPNDNEYNQTAHESSRSRLRALQCVLRTLIESPHINEHINVNWVKKSSYYDSNFTDKECEVVADLANALRPYIPRKRPSTDSPNLQNSISHVTLRAPLAIITNTILRATGYSHFTRRMTPQISPASLHGLALGPVGIYEVLCHRSENHFDVRDMCGSMVTDYRKITLHSQNRKAILGSFFDLNKIKEICKAHGLTFRDRITFVDRYTIQLTGTVIPNGPDRSGAPVRSELEHRKKLKIKAPSSNRWHEEFLKSRLGKDTVLQEVKVAVEAVKFAEKEIKGPRKDMREKEQTQNLQSIRVKNQEPNSYIDLCKAREKVRDGRKALLPLEANLRQLRQRSYYWRNMEKAARSKYNSNSARKSRGSTSFTTPTWDHPTVEDITDKLDISYLQTNTQGKNRMIVYAGTDYGLRTMSETVVQTHHQIETHINRYHVLFGNAGTCVGSRLGGHARRGGLKMRAEHLKHTTVAITDEYRTSQTCVYCFEQVRQARSRRLVDGRVKTVSVHGTVECINPDCISFKCGYSIKPRDAHAAVAIAISGASRLFDSDRMPLPPFSRGFKLRDTITTNNTSSILETSSSQDQYRSHESTDVEALDYRL